MATNPFLEALKRGNFGQGPAPDIPQVAPTIQVPQIGTGQAPIFDRAQTMDEFLQSPFAKGVAEAAGQAQAQAGPLPAGATIRTPEQDIAAARGLSDPSAGITTTSLGPNFQQTGVGQVGSPVPQAPAATPAPTPQAPSAFGALPTMVPDVQAGAGSLTGMAPMGVSGLPTEGTYQQPQGSTFIDATPQPTGAMGVEATRAMFGGRTLSQYLSDPNVEGAGLMTDPQGRMIDPDVDRSEYEQLSAARSAAAGPNLTSIAGQPRPGVDVPSLAMQRERMAAGLDPVEGAPMGTGMSQQQQRDYLAGGRDPATGQKIPTSEGQMTPYQKAQIELQKAGLGLKMSEAEAKAAGVDQARYDKMSKAAGALQSLSADLNLVKEKGQDIKDLTMKPRTEGLLAKALTKVSPKSTAAQLQRASDTLTGDAFIKGMRIIKEFGGGLGSVTEVEGTKVERAQGAIFEAGMSDQERREAVDNYIQVRENAYNRIRSAFVDEFGEEAAGRYLGGGRGDAQSGTTQGNVPNVEGVTITKIG